MGEWDFLEKSLEEAKNVTNKEIDKGEFNLERWFKELFNTDTLKEINAYNKSEENQKNCEPFKQLNQKYILLHKQYKNSFNDLYQGIEEKTYRHEYAKGGAGFHRGFYSPSMMDLVVGGINRGRLLKKLPQKGKHIYEYLFDEEDRLICVHYYGYYNDEQRPTETELFVREDNKILSLVFEYNESIGHQLSCMSECHYEKGKLMQYQHVHCYLLGYKEVGFYGKNCSEIHVEVYDHTDDLLQSFCYYKYTPFINLLSQEKYSFTIDAEGYLSTYSVERFSPGKGFVLDPNTYKVQAKRK